MVVRVSDASGTCAHGEMRCDALPDGDRIMLRHLRGYFFSMGDDRSGEGILRCRSRTRRVGGGGCMEGALG